MTTISQADFAGLFAVGTDFTDAFPFVAAVVEVALIPSCFCCCKSQCET